MTLEPEQRATGLRIAYLVNRYPAASHSFIRREIEAVEAAGAIIDRWSVRRPGSDLPDAQDRAEVERTRYILAAGISSLILAAFKVALLSPIRFWSALRCTLSMAQPQVGSWARHCAYLAEAAYLAAAFKRDGVDHVHAHFGTNPAAVARLVRRLGGPTYSFTVHGPDEFDDPKGLDLHGKIKEASVIFTISHFGSSQLMRWSDPIDWEKIKIARCGVDGRYITQAYHEAAPVAPILCCVARLSAQKGLPLLIQAAAQVKRDFGAFTLNLVGDGELRPNIEAMIKEFDLTSSVHIIGWSDSAAVQTHLIASRAMVLPSFAEGLPVVIMEALALQRPVIVSAIAGTPELVDQSCGWVVPAGSVEAVASAMMEALRAEPLELLAMGAEGRKRVLDAHDALRNGKNLYQIIVETKVNRV
jgi:colanic acid/amylovoran biosynthesis glycosyltransferase